MSRFRRVAAIGLLTFAAAPVISGCLRDRDPLLQQSSFALPRPGKDEVGTVDGKTFSLQSFINLRGILRNQAQEHVLWVGFAALALRSDSEFRSQPIPFVACLDLSRFAAGELELAEGERILAFFGKQLPGVRSATTLRAYFDSLLKQAEVRKNEQALALLR